MKIGILEAGAPPIELKERYGSYSQMAAELLGPTFETRVYDARAQVLPKDPEEADGYLITGSSAGVYDPEPWIAPLEAFIRRTAGMRPLVGICFGHQLMAEALGGRARKSEKGWAVGLNRYDLVDQAPFLDPVGSFALAASHQDQVTAVGSEGRVLAASSFTPFAMVEYPRLRALSLQPHPEFEPAFAQALIDRRRGVSLDPEAADAAKASLEAPNDRARVGLWIRRFLTDARAP